MLRRREDLQPLMLAVPADLMIEAVVEADILIVWVGWLWV